MGERSGRWATFVDLLINDPLNTWALLVFTVMGFASLVSSFYYGVIADSYFCQHPTTRGGHCRNPRRPDGQRCRAGHRQGWEVHQLIWSVAFLVVAIIIVFQQPLPSLGGLLPQ